MPRKPSLVPALGSALALVSMIALPVQAAPPVGGVCGDVNKSSTVTATDALLVLKKSVGQKPTLDCSGYENAISQVYDQLLTCRAATCGNGVAEYGEACDGNDLHGKSCATEAPATPYGTLACKVTCDGFDTGGCRPRFTDNGNGTISDNATGLMWEKKTTTVGSGASADPHDVDNIYTWTAGTTAANGTLFTEFLAKLNGFAGEGCLGGQCDWRLPTRPELEGILDYGGECGTGGTCIDPIFGPTQGFLFSYFDPEHPAYYQYWTCSSLQDYPEYVWTTDFGNTNYNARKKTSSMYVRAVR